MKHIGALVAMTVLVFGTIFLFTSEWPLRGPATDEAPTEVAESPPPPPPPPAPAPAPETPPAEPEPQAEAEAVEDEPAAEEQPAAEPEPAPAEEPAQAEEPAAAEEAAPAEEPASEEAGGEADMETLLAAGEEIYPMCQACHGAQGEGGIGPAFADNADLEDAQLVAATLIHGREAMPPFGSQLDDDEIASIATFIRNSFGNDFGPVTPDEAAAER